MPAKSAVPIHDPLQHARALIDAAGETPPRLTELARQIGLSASHLQRAFRKRYGLSPAEYAQAQRLQRLKSALRKNPRVTDAIYAAGFGSGSRVYEKTGQWLGMTPADYRRGGAGVSIRFTTLPVAIGHPALGHLLVAASQRGICAVTIGDDENVLAANLQAEFPDASLDRVDAGRDDWLAAIIGRVQAQLGGGNNPDLPAPPLDIRATAFQWRVWQALQRIPCGQTRSYAQVAADIGAPRAVRAVASACARNRLAVVVPCHRVIRSDGSLGGYRWGIARKRDLLASETRAVPAGS